MKANEIMHERTSNRIKVQMHEYGPIGNRKYSLVDMRTRKTRATSFNGQFEAKAYANKRNWFISPVNIIEPVSN